MRSNIFFTQTFFLLLFIMGCAYMLAFFYPDIFPLVNIALGAMIMLSTIDLIFVFRKTKPLEVERVLPSRMSNNDSNWVKLRMKNLTSDNFKLRIWEELPHQLDKRNFVIKQKLRKKERLEHLYEIEPRVRGLYQFGNLNVFLRSYLGLIERKIVKETPQELKVYPSYVDLNKYDLNTIKSSLEYGIRKTRKLGHSSEFEQIKNYVNGDNIRHINWKATAKRNAFMVNQYTDEKSKEVYCIIDTGRSMRYPFNELALFDYAINSSLIILNNALKSQDKAGVISFNKKINQFLKAEKKPSYIKNVLEKLYAIQPQFFETDFSNLYVLLKRQISHRALLFLFTNFENYDSFERQLPSLMAINKSHVLVVIFFKNVEIENELKQGLIKRPVQKAIIEKQINEKQRILSELNRRRIQAIYTSPDDLTIDLLNMYIEIKAKALV